MGHLKAYNINKNKKIYEIYEKTLRRNENV